MNQRAQHYRTGLWAETKAAWFLRLKGWRILESRWQSGFGEVDIIAKRGRQIIFVEVKARGTFEQALNALTEHQWRRIESAADIYMARRKALAHCSWRFDAVCVMPAALPKHFEAIWHP